MMTGRTYVLKDQGSQLSWMPKYKFEPNWMDVLGYKKRKKMVMTRKAVKNELDRQTEETKKRKRAKSWSVDGKGYYKAGDSAKTANTV